MAQQSVAPSKLAEPERAWAGLGTRNRGQGGGGRNLLDGSRTPRAPRPKLWHPDGCGNWVNNIGAQGHEGAALVLLGREAFRFCGLARTARFLYHMCQVIYEGEGSLWFLLGDSISESRAGPQSLLVSSLSEDHRGPGKEGTLCSQCGRSTTRIAERTEMSGHPRHGQRSKRAHGTGDAVDWT